MRKNFTRLITKVNSMKRQPQVVGLLLLFMMLVSQTAVGQTITSISPKCVTAGGNSFTLTVIGENYNGSSAIYLNGVARTTQVNGNTLTTTVPSDLIQTSTVIKVQAIRGSTLSTAVDLFVFVSPQIVSAPPRCGTGTVTLTASGAPTGASYQWYDARGNAISGATNSSYTTPEITATTNYFVSMTAPGGCESTRTAVSATINNLSASPITTSDSRCGNGTVQLSASGAPEGGSYRWYTQEIGGTPINGATTATFTTPSLNSTTTYWVSTVNAAECESTTRTAVVATVNPIPDVPVATSNARCETGTVTLSATAGNNGTTVRWYTASSGGSPIETGATYTTPSITSTTIYYASSFNETTGCESARVPVEATVNSLPTVTLADLAPICVEASAIPLTGGLPAGGIYSGVGVTNGTFNPATAGVGPHVITYTYTDGNGCINSASKTIQVTAAPGVTLDSFSPVCANGGAITLTGGFPVGGTYRVNDAVATQFNPATAGAGTHTITYTVTQNGCAITATQTILVNPAPVVTFLPISAVCVDAAAFTLTGGRVGGAVPITGTWVYSGTGVSGEDFNPADAGVGTHQITYTYTTPEGCTNFATQNIIVHALPNVTLANFADVCVSAAPITLGGGLPTGGTYSGPGVSNGIFDPATAGAGGHTITYTYTNANGCTSTATNTITVKPLPVISVTNSLAICIGGSATLTASGATTYRWEPATGLSATTGATVTASPTQTTTYTVYGITDGCESEARTVTVTVNPLPSATITPTGPTNFCEGNSVVLNAPVGTGYTYAWYRNGASEVYSSDRSISVLTSGSYVVQVINSFGCSATSSPMEVIVVEIDPNVATITNTGSLTFCQGQSVLLQAAAAPSGQVYEYQWQVNKGSGEVWENILEDADGRTYRAAASGRYRVVVTNVPQDEEAQCSKTSSSLTVTVNPLPVADAGADQTLCAIAGAPTNFIMAGIATNGTGQWTVVGGSQTGSASATITNPGSPNATVSVSGAGSVRVRYTVTSNANPSCNSTFDEVTLTVNPLPVASAGPDQTLCATGEATTFTLAGSVANGTGLWSVVSGNATISNTSSMTSTVSVTGTGSVVLQLLGTSNTDPACGTGTDQVTLTVNPLPTANAGADQNKCGTGNSTTFNLSGSVTNGTGAWSIVSGNNIASISSTTDMTPTVTVTEPGTVVVRLTSTSNLTPQCTAATDDVTLRVYTTPIASVTATGSTTVCGGSITLTASSAPANQNFTYQWYNGSGAIQGQTGTTYNATASGDYYVIVTNPENGGCASAASSAVAVTVNPVPTAATNVATSATALCGSGTVTLSATAGDNANTVRWYSANTGGTLLETGLSVGRTVNTTTTFFAASYNTTTGCESITRVPVTVTVNPIPAAPGNVTVNPTSVCGSGSVTLSATAGSNATTVRWYNSATGGSPFATDLTHTLSVNQTTTFYAASYNPTTNCESSTRVGVTVTSNPVIATPSITNLIPNKVYYSAESSFILTGSNPGTGNKGVFSGPGVTQEGNNYRFTPCNALLAGQNERSINITYTVSSNSTNCENFVTVPIRVKRSTYTTIVTADPFPTCKGQNTNYTARVYRDAEVIYPYLVNDQGIPVKSDMVTPLGNKEYPLPNPAYFDDPSSIPQILWINTYRYYQPRIVSGVLMDAGLFDYEWTKNMDGRQFGNSPTVGNAGLSSLDYYAVRVTNKAAGTTCAPAIDKKVSNRVYTAAPVAYEVGITSNNNIICQGGSVTVSANLNQSFGFWNDISLTLYLMHSRNGVVTQIEARPYATSDGFTVSFSTSGGTVGGLQDGDLLYIEFSSVIDKQSEVRSKCSQDFMTNQIRVTVVAQQTMTAGAARCINGAGVPVGLTSSQAGVLYQLRRDGVNVGSPITGTGNAITFGNFTEAGTYSVQALAGTAACLSFGETVINVTALPQVQTLTVANNGEYCMGGDGVPVTLANSQTGVSYQLRRTVSGVTTDIGTAMPGSDGQPVNFGNQTAGVYSVSATTVAVDGTVAACTQEMGSVTITMLDLPAITAQPQSGVLCEGGSTSFSVTASGAGVTYQWQKDGVNIPNAINNTLNLSNVTTQDAGEYTVIVSGTCSPAVTSAVANLTVNTAPIVTAGPKPLTVCEGERAYFSVSATGTNLTYQWRKNGALIEGANGSEYTIEDVSAVDGGNYTVTVAGICGSLVITEVALLTVNTNPLISAQPAATEVCSGGSVSFNITATGTGLSYQWLKDGEVISGATGSSYSITSTDADDAAAYSVRITGTCNTVESEVAQLTINEAPSIVQGPVNQEVCSGKENVSFSVAASGTALSYQWYHNGRLIQGATESDYVVPVASDATSGTYTVLVSGTCTPPITQEATLSVNPLPTVTVASTSACVGESSIITAEAINGSGDYSYSWIVPDGVTDPGNVASFSTDIAGDYTVSVIDQNSNCAGVTPAIATVTLTTRQDALRGEIRAENAIGPITSENPIAIGDKVTFKVYSEVIDNGAIAAYNWYIGDGTDDGWVLQSDATTDVFIIDPIEEGEFMIKCEVLPGEGNCFNMHAVLMDEPIIPLPVELLYFNATKRGSDVVLDWATASELDNKGFEVQVSSDAKNFRSLGFVESKVNTTSLKQLYTFVDKEKGKQGVRYYRLKQVDLDGKFEIFNIKAVHFDEVSMNKVKAYPNPFHSEVELSIDAELDGELLITVTTATGQQLLQRSVQVAKGTNIEKLTLDPNLPRGVYIISTRMGDFNSHFKLLKQ